MTTTRILAIDGGGIRGIISSKVLVTLESLLQKHSGRKDSRIADYFDIIGGTSAGGILTALYLCPDKKNIRKARYSAQEVMDMFIEDGKNVFSKSIFHDLRSLFGLVRPKYPTKNLERKSDEYFGDVKLSELIKPCVITSYDIERSSAVFFDQISAKKTKDKDFYVKDIARATSAAPVFFSPANITSVSNKAYPLIDGGIFANNPAMCAYAESKKLKKETTLNDIIMLSIGNSSNDLRYTYKKAKNWGMIQWSIPILEILMSGISETVDYELRYMFEAVGKSDNYLRIEPNKNYAPKIRMDKATDKNIAILKEVGDRLSKEYMDKLDSLARKLVYT